MRSPDALQWGWMPHSSRAPISPRSTCGCYRSDVANDGAAVLPALVVIEPGRLGHPTHTLGTPNCPVVDDLGGVCSRARMVHRDRVMGVCQQDASNVDASGVTYSSGQINRLILAHLRLVNHRRCLWPTFTRTSAAPGSRPKFAAAASRYNKWLLKTETHHEKPPSRLTRGRISKLNMSSSGFGDGAFARGVMSFSWSTPPNRSTAVAAHQAVEQRDGVGDPSEAIT